MKKVYMPDINVQHVAIGDSHGLVLESHDRDGRKQVFLMAASGEPGRLSEAAVILGDALQEIADILGLKSERETSGEDAAKFANR